MTQDNGYEGVNTMLNSFRCVNYNGEETVSTKTYNEESVYVENVGEIGVIAKDFYNHLILAGYDTETIDSALRQLISEKA